VAAHWHQPRAGGRVGVAASKTGLYESADCAEIVAAAAPLEGPQLQLRRLQPGGNHMYRQFNIQQFYVLPTPCICVLCGSENKKRLFPYTALTDWLL